MKSLKLTVASLFLLTLSLPALAGGVQNHFNDGINNFTALNLRNGVLGSFFDDGKTVWDGVYLVESSIAGGTGAFSGTPASTLIADATTFPGFLTVNSINGGWSGANNDGFFVFKVVQGDFDVSVQIENPFANPANADNFPGLLVRAFSFPDGSPGGSVNPTNFPLQVTNNQLENSIGLWRFNQFSLDGQISEETNGARDQESFPGSNSDTNSVRGLRVQRVSGSNFFVYVSTNGGPWFSITNANTGGNYVKASGLFLRPDLATAPLQVGIVQPTFSANQAQTFFADFELTNANINVGAIPADPTGVSATAAGTNTFVFSWTPGAGNTGSLVVISKNADSVDSQPADSFTFTGNTNYNFGFGYTTGSATNTFLYHATNWIAFAGANVGAGVQSIAVNGFGSTNNFYYVRVYGSTGSGTSTVYSKNPSQFIQQGVGTVSAVSFTLAPTNIPIGGAARATVTATFSTGDVINASADPSTAWGSDNAAVAVANAGVVSALTNGSANISITNNGVSATNLITVHIPAFRDEFGTTVSYLQNRIQGSTWDGVYVQGSDIAGEQNANGPGNATVFDANITTNGTLTIRANNDGWENNAGNSPFIYKTVTGDFQVVTHIAWNQILTTNTVRTTNGAIVTTNFVPTNIWLANQQAGLMARLAHADGSPGGTSNAAFPLGREDHMSYWRVDLFNLSTSERRTLNGGGNVANDAVDADYEQLPGMKWLLVTRTGTDWQFYKKTSFTDNWLLQTKPNQLNTAVFTNGSTMQVGLTGPNMYNAATGFIEYDHFIIDNTNLPAAGTPPTGPAITSINAFGNSTITLNWTTNGDGLGSIVVVHAKLPVNASPINGVTYVGSTNFGAGSNLGNNNFVVYVGTGNTVTVSNLIPATTYYAAVFTYNGTGTGGTPSYALTSMVYTNAVASGVVSNFTFVLTTPANGSNVLWQGASTYTSTLTFTNGAQINATVDTNFLSLDPTIAIATNGVLTVFTNNAGSATFRLAYLTVTNTVTVAVHNPTWADNFNANYTYVDPTTQATNAVSGIWNGAYYNFGDVPNGNNGSGTAGETFAAVANSLTNSQLVVSNFGGDWENAGDDGFLLWKQIPGDFQVSTHIVYFDSANAYNTPGLLARAYSAGGAPLAGGESGVSWTRFDEFGDTTYARSTINSGTTETPNTTGTNRYLLMKKTGSVWTFFERPSTNAGWLNTTPLAFPAARADLNGPTLQVGIQEAMFNSGSTSNGTAVFDTFFLDATSGPRITYTTNDAGNITLTWGGAAGDWFLQGAPALTDPNAPPAWTNITGASFVDGTNSLTLPEGPGQHFFRVIH